MKRAVDIQATAYLDGDVDRAVESASRAVDELCHRTFHPTVATRYFDWPNANQRGAAAWRLWLDDDELISVTTLTSGGTAIAASDYFLEPANTGPPYNRIEIDLSSSASFDAGDTHQRSIVVAGVFGSWNAETAISTVTGTLEATHGTLTINPDTAGVGVGDTLHIDDEYIQLTDVAFTDTTQNLGGDLTASNADQSVSVTDGTAYGGDETLKINDESMRVRSISGNTLTVTRAVDGSTLAAHTTGADIYALRAFTATRGTLGSTAAAHTDSTTVYRLDYPALVRDLTIGEAVNRLQNEDSGYARVVGSVEGGALEPSARGLKMLRDDCYAAHGRKGRVWAV